MTHDRAALDAALKGFGADVLVEARYVGLHDEPVCVGGLQSLDEYHAFEIVKVLAGRDQRVSRIFLPEEGREFTRGRAYWLAARQGESWRVVG